MDLFSERFLTMNYLPWSGKLRKQSGYFVLFESRYDSIDLDWTMFDTVANYFTTKAITT